MSGPDPAPRSRLRTADLLPVGSGSPGPARPTCSDRSIGSAPTCSPSSTAARSRARRPRRRPLDHLSPREREVLTSLARGRSNRQIAKALQISEETVKAHVSSILAKLQLADRTQAAIFGLQQRLVPLDQALER
jgi:RNA polymerase sigma factor (sigma-70 family)